MVRDVHFLGPMTRYQSGQAGAVTTNGGYRRGSARTWPSLRQAPLNPCGTAVQRPEGIAQRRERQRAILTASTQGFRMRAPEGWPRLQSRAPPLTLRRAAHVVGRGG